MSWPLPPRLYVSGTDTDVGKTVCSALLCALGGYTYWKPVQAGRPTDRERVSALAGVPTLPEVWLLDRPASPHAAARDQGLRITPESLRLPAVERLLVEGAGGWCVPYAEDPLRFQAEIVRALGLPVLVVARSGLGTLNHSFLTLRALKQDGIDCIGLLLVGPPHPENERDLGRWGARVWGRVDRVEDLEASFPSLLASLAKQILAQQIGAAP